MADLFVTWRGEEEFDAEFNFKTYQFRPNEPVEMSEAAVKHIFGHGQTDKEPYLARLGWVRLHSELKQALEKLAKVEITDQLPTKDRSLPSAVGVVPLHVEKRAGGRNQSRVG
jgi:hypothetical protein